MPRRAAGRRPLLRLRPALRGSASHHPAHEEWPVGEHEAPFLVYLAVWEQAVSAIQAPELIDPALGAGVPDTTRRPR